MKTLILLSLFILIQGCSSKKGALVAPDYYLKLNQQHRPKHLACKLHQDKLVSKAFTEAEDAELDDENYFFVRNEKTALSFINNFDLTKFTLVENQLEYQAVIGACLYDKNIKLNTCETNTVTYKFFRGLIYGLRQYSWSDATKRKATQLTLNYLDYVARSQSSVLDILLANDLLQRLAEHSLNDPKLYQATWDFKQTSEKKFEDLKEKVRNLEKKELDCQDANKFYLKERETVKELSESFLVLLKHAQIS